MKKEKSVHRFPGLKNEKGIERKDKPAKKKKKESRVGFGVFPLNLNFIKKYVGMKSRIEQ